MASSFTATPSYPGGKKKKKPGSNQGSNTQGHGAVGKGSPGDPYGTEAISDLYEPPPFSTYDPALDAAAQAAVRGYQDIAQDFVTQKKIDKQDYRQTKQDIRQDQKRGTQDLRRDKRRGRLDFQQERQDLAKTRARGQQDFNRRVGDMLLKYGIMSNRQAQSANAQGVADAGTLGAAAEARAFNQGRELSTLQTAKARQEQDIATTLERLGIDQQQFMADIKRSQTRLGQDTARAKELAKRDFKRERREQRRNLKRAEREAIQAQIDYSEQAAYNAHATHPGAVDEYGNPKDGYKPPKDPDAKKSGSSKSGGSKKGGGRKGRKKPKKRGGFTAT